MESKTTSRGFHIYRFADGNGCQCSLQESSVARFQLEDGAVTDGFIWLGVDKDSDGNPARQATMSDGSMVPMGARMHLSQSQVRDLLPLLEYFVEHGDLSDDPA